MKSGLRSVVAFGMAVALGLGAFTGDGRADNVAQSLPFSQNWTNTGLITANDNWAGVPGIEGTWVTVWRARPVPTRRPSSPWHRHTLDVIANQTDPTRHQRRRGRVRASPIRSWPSGLGHGATPRSSSSTSTRPVSPASRCPTTCATSTARPTTRSSRSRCSSASATPATSPTCPAGFVADASTGPEPRHAGDARVRNAAGRGQQPAARAGPHHHRPTRWATTSGSASTTSTSPPPPSGRRHGERQPQQPLRGRRHAPHRRHAGGHAAGADRDRDRRPHRHRPDQRAALLRRRHERRRDIGRRDLLRPGHRGSPHHRRPEGDPDHHPGHAGPHRRGPHRAHRPEQLHRALRRGSRQPVHGAAGQRHAVRRSRSRRAPTRPARASS